MLSVDGQRFSVFICFHFYLCREYHAIYFVQAMVVTSILSVTGCCVKINRSELLMEPDTNQTRYQDPAKHLWWRSINYFRNKSSITNVYRVLKTTLQTDSYIMNLSINLRIQSEKGNRKFWCNDIVIVNQLLNP